MPEFVHDLKTFSVRRFPEAAPKVGKPNSFVNHPYARIIVIINVARILLLRANGALDRERDGNRGVPIGEDVDGLGKKHALEIEQLEFQTRH
jgi:hypothetical protein